MVNRKTIFRGIFVDQETAKQFEGLAEPGETKTETLQKIIRAYKSKCHGQQDRGVLIAD